MEEEKVVPPPSDEGKGDQENEGTVKQTLKRKKFGSKGNDLRRSASSLINSRVSIMSRRLSSVSHRLSQIVLEQEKSLYEILAKIRRREIVIRDMTLIVGFYFLGSLSLHYIEGWSFNKSLYFISSTVSTVGYGDVVPHTNLGQLVSCIEILIGVTLVFTRVRKYISSIHGFINSKQIKLFDALGYHIYDSDSLPIYKYSPNDVNHLINYRAKYFVAFLPLAIQILIAFGFAKGFMGLTVIQAIYFTLTTCTTVGYGDYGPDDSGSRKRMARAFLSVYLFLLCILMSNTFHEMILISVRRRIITGQSKPDIEAMLLKKARVNPRSKSGYHISESEYIVEALLNDNLVDRQVLLAIRRQYHWTARAGDDCRLDITAQDLFVYQKELESQYYEHRRQEQKSAKSYMKRRAQRFIDTFTPQKTNQVFPQDRQQTLCADNPLDQCYLSSTRKCSSKPRKYSITSLNLITGPPTAGLPLKGETYEQWRVRYWDPRVNQERAEGIRASLNREITDPFTVERAEHRPSYHDDINEKAGRYKHSRNTSCANHCHGHEESQSETNDPVQAFGASIGANVPTRQFFQKLGDSDTDFKRIDGNQRTSSNASSLLHEEDQQSLQQQRRRSSMRRASSLSSLDDFLTTIQL